MLELYHHSISVCAQKVRLALFEKGLSWHGHYIDLTRGEQVSAAYLALNPKGVVPTLIDNGQPVIESSIILEYLEDAYPKPSLRPGAPLERADMRRWIRIPDDGLHAACGTVSYAAAFAAQLIAQHGRAELDERLAKLPDRARAARQTELLDKGLAASFVPAHIGVYDQALAEMENALSDGRVWLAGAQYSLAECALLPYVWRLERLNLHPMWDERPNLAAWFERAKARASWAQAMEAFPPAGPHDYDDDLSAKGVDPWALVKQML